jgi:hypothetical protein
MPLSPSRKETTTLKMKVALSWILLCIVLYLPSEVDGVSDSFAVPGRKAEFTGTRKKSISNGAQTPCNGVPSVPTHRRACNFYIWDAPSALFYKWCHHLVKDHIYEGKGGHMVCVSSCWFDCSGLGYLSVAHKTTIFFDAALL